MMHCQQRMQNWRKHPAVEVVEADPAAVHFLCRKVLPVMMILLERWYCGRMNPNKARQVTKASAESQGYDACSKCW